MSEPSPGGRPTATTTEPAAGGGFPKLLGRAGVYAVYVTAAVVTLVVVSDLDVLLLHPVVAGLLALIVAGGPLVGMLLGTFGSYVNYYGTWRILRGKDEYEAGQDLKSHAADIPEAVQAALAGRRGCLSSAVPLALLFVSLVLAGAANVPPGTPGIGPLGSWQHPNAPGDVQLVTPTPKIVTVETVTAEPTATATAVPTATATARPTAVPRPTATATATPNPVQFTVTPLTFTYSMCPNAPDAPAVTLTLDNTKSTVDVSWQATVVELDGSNAPWATILDPVTGSQVTSGTVPAGKTQRISVTPNPALPAELCRSSLPNGKVWHVTIATPNAGTFTFAYTVS